MQYITAVEFDGAMQKLADDAGGMAQRKTNGSEITYTWKDSEVVVEFHATMLSNSLQFAGRFCYETSIFKATHISIQDWLFDNTTMTGKGSRIRAFEIAHKICEVLPCRCE